MEFYFSLFVFEIFRRENFKKEVDFFISGEKVSNEEETKRQHFLK